LTSDRSWLVCGETAAALRVIASEFLGTTDPEQPLLREISHHLLEREGKLLRPALALLAGRFSSPGDEAKIRHAAIAVELLHVASLYHDDVMDDASQRRGAQTANSRWGNALASLGGTYLFAQAGARFASLGAWANRIASAAMAQLCAGQLLELEHAFDLELSESDYFEILTKKTATLFELPLRLGAFVGGAAEEQVENLASFGRTLGLAYQIADDASDFAGDNARSGKAAGADLKRGVYTLPVIRACRSAATAQELRGLLGRLEPSDGEIAAAAHLIVGSGAVEDALALARDTARRAQTHLSELPPGTARESLFNLAEQTVALFV